MKRWAGIARFGGIGDNLIAASVLAPLKRLGYMTEVITSPPNDVVYLHNPYIDKLAVKVVERDLPQGDLPSWQGWIESRAKEYDIFLHASHTAEGRHAVFKSMSSFWWPDDYRRRLCAGSYLETVHDVMGVPHDFGPLYFSSAEEKAYAQQVKSKIGKFILWVVCGSRIDKMYPYAPTAVARLIREVGPVVVMGGPTEKEQSSVAMIRDVVMNHNGNRDGLHLAVPEAGGVGSWPLRTSLTFAQAADLVVTPDTGVGWAVAMESMPKVLMVSHASAENIGKHWKNTTILHADPQRVSCWPCHRLHDDPSTCRENKEKNGAACISDISVDRLVKTVAESWKRRNNVVEVQFGINSNVA